MKTFGKNWNRRLEDAFHDPPTRAEKKCFHRMLRGIRKDAVARAGSTDEDRRDPFCDEVKFGDLGYYSSMVTLPRRIRSTVLDWYHEDCAERASAIGVSYARPRETWKLENKQ